MVENGGEITAPISISLEFQMRSFSPSFLPLGQTHIEQKYKKINIVMSEVMYCIDLSSKCKLSSWLHWWSKYFQSLIYNSTGLKTISLHFLQGIRGQNIFCFVLIWLWQKEICKLDFIWSSKGDFWRSIPHWETRQGQASGMNWTLHTDLWKSETSRDIKK